MLSGKALDLAYELRALAGPLIQGDGPPMAELRARADLSDDEFQAALKELQDIRFVTVDASHPDTGVIVLAPLQIYLDDLENQGSDDV